MRNLIKPHELHSATPPARTHTSTVVKIALGRKNGNTSAAFGRLIFLRKGLQSTVEPVGECNASLVRFLTGAGHRCNRREKTFEGSELAQNCRAPSKKFGRLIEGVFFAQNVLQVAVSLYNQVKGEFQKTNLQKERVRMIAEELKTYTGWNNIADGYFTKTRLRKEMKLKPKDENKPDAFVKANTPRGWKEFNLYSIGSCREIHKRKVEDSPLTDENIAQSLYLLNKSAKKSRDTKQENYYIGKHSIVQRSKSRQTKLYDLKSQVIKKLVSKKKASIIGYHTQEIEHEVFYLLMVEFAGYNFHLPLSKEKTKNLDYMGCIEKIPATAKKVEIKFNEAVKLLKRYKEEAQ
ncbi:MAG TPA: YkyB family protein [Bacillales bacterium]|nr:YkyB family protein [Bacillales bacterium]